MPEGYVSGSLRRLGSNNPYSDYYDGEVGVAETSAGYRLILKTLVGYTFGPYISPWLNYTWETVYLESTSYDDPPEWA